MTDTSVDPGTHAFASIGAEPLVPAYLERIGVTPPVEATLAGLRTLHAAHAAAIPFENLDILLGRPIRLDLAHLRAKLVDRRRGGYCFEQNTLFLAVLRELGFAATPMEARVRSGSGILPRTHMIVGVQMESEEWLADVGFGGDGPLQPVSMRAGSAVDGSPGADRIIQEGTLRVLQRRSPSAWIDLYSFVPERVYPVDFEMANWYTSTHPQSRFVRTLTAQRSTADVRYVLRYPTYSEIRGGDVRSRDISRSDLLPLLRDVFLIDLPPETRFAVIDGTAPAGPV